ncbi:MAG: hypothetical protein ACNA78_04220 [Balneolaceae bacterium]
MKTRKNSTRNKITAIFGLIMLFWTPAGLIAQDAPSNLDELIRQAQEAGIDQAQLQTLQSRAAAAGLSQAETAMLLRPALTMAERNLPHEMVFDKAFEGLSKRIPAQRMVPVLQQMTGHAQEAAAFVDPWIERPAVQQAISRREGGMDRAVFRREMVRAGAKGLSQQFDRDVLESTLDAVGTESIMNRTTPGGIIMAINVLSDLPEAAQLPAESARVILQALESGFDAGQMQRLPAAMNMAQRRSQLPAQAVAEGLNRQLQGGMPASQVLQNLFNGEIGAGPPGNIPPGLERGRPDRGQGPPNN